MTTARPATKTKTVRQSRYCKNPECKKQFKVASTSRKLYCQTSCSTKIQNKKRPRVDRLDKARRTPFMYYIAREVKRATTLDILHGHTAESIVDLYQVWKFSFKANDYGSRKDFELSHIAPTNGNYRLGLLHAENLCVAPKALNKAHSVNHYGHGKSISRASIDPVNHVSQDEPEGVVLDRVIQYLGEQLVSDVVRAAKLQPSQKSKHLEWLDDNLDPTNPEHRKHIAALSDMTTVALSNLRNKLHDKLPNSFVMPMNRYQSLDVLCRELIRLAAYREDLQDLAADMHLIRSFKRYNWSVSPVEEQALFDVLHGKSFADLETILSKMVDHSIPLMQHDMLRTFYGEYNPQANERIPAYDSIMLIIPQMVTVRVFTQTQEPWFDDNMIPF